MNRICAMGVLLVAGAPGMLRGAFEERPFSARSAALGEAAVASPGGGDAPYENPAGLASSDRFEVGLGHTDLLGMPEMPRNTVSAVAPGRGRVGWGMYGVDFGSSLYREREVGLAAGGSLDPSSALGVILKGQQMSVERYGRAAAWQMDVGWLGRPVPLLGLGFVVRNATQSRFRGLPDKSAAVFQAGARFDFWNGAPAFLALRRGADGSGDWRWGQEILIRSSAIFRMGYCSSPARWALGWGFAFSQWSMDYAFLTHPKLPDQHQFNLTWRGPRRLRSPSK